MNESTKTLTFLGVALAAVALAFATRPSTADYDVSTEKGKPIVKFDPEEAKRMKVVQFDEATATLREFEVAEDEGVWTIPSKGGYPADAEKRMGQAVNAVMDREILNVVSNNAADHDKFGVVDPGSSKLEVGQTGVGTRVTFAGATGEPLVDLIIGKPVKDATGQHYVRKPSQDPVYVVEISPDDFSTKFEDWIEPDLLKLNAFDVQEVTLNDYSASAEIVMTQQGPRLGLNEERRDKLTLVYDEKAGEWHAKDLRTFDKASDSYKDFNLKDDQELNDDSLRELKNALDDLRIVDVDSKPAGLSANLKAGKDFLQDEQALRSLVPRGFIPVASGPNEVEILSSEGEVIATQKDGVEYVLRFGELKLAQDGKTDAANQAEADPEGAADAEGKKEGEGVDRYLFVMARFNENAVEKPVLEELPALPEAEKTDEEKGADGKKPADASEEKAAKEQPDQEKPGEDAEAKPAEEGEKPAEEQATPEEDSAKKLEEAIANRKTIEQENQRKLDEYQQTLEKGRERVKELNDRFGDWYYVISNDVFKKIHLGKADLITVKKPAEAEGTEAPATPAAPFGAPGTAIPGLPAVPVAPATEDSPEEKEAPAAETTAAEEGTSPAEEAKPEDAPQQEN